MYYIILSMSVPDHADKAVIDLVPVPKRLAVDGEVMRSLADDYKALFLQKNPQLVERNFTYVVVQVRKL